MAWSKDVQSFPKETKLGVDNYKCDNKLPMNHVIVLLKLNGIETSKQTMILYTFLQT